MHGAQKREFSANTENIGIDAFASCTNLPNVSIPASVASIGDGAFSRCSNLAAITAADGNQHYATVAGVLFSKDKRTLVCCPGGKAGNFSDWPAGTVSIAAKAFAGCVRLGNVNIPASVETIGEEAFADGALGAVLGGTGVKAIGGFAFSGCTNLTGVGGCCQSVPVVKWGTFFGCTKLDSVTLGDGVAEIEGVAFYGCSSLRIVVFGKGLTTIGDHAFYRCSKLLSQSFPVNLTSIGNYAFCFCTNMSSVFCHDGMESIGAYAFDNSALGTLSVPGAWEGTGKLANVGLPAGCTVIYRKSLKTVWRFYSKKYKGHFFTIDEKEKNDLIAKNPNWDFEGGAYRAYTNHMSGTVKLHRFYSKKYKGHFYTVDETEKVDLEKNNPNWNYEGVAYYVYPEEVSGSVPVFRFWSKKYKHHFYTIDEEEKADLVANNPNWAFERIAFYARPLEEGAGGGTKGVQEKAANGKPVCGAVDGVVVTTSDGADGAAVCDGDEATGWTPGEAGASWVVLSFAGILEVADVEVVGENLPEGTRILLSEDADEWAEEVPGTARYVWVAMPAVEEGSVVREIRVLSGNQ